MIALLFLAALYCDGVTDDTAMYTAAIEYARVGTDKTVELPAGICLMKQRTPELRDGVNLIGQNQSYSIIQCNVGGTSCVRVCMQGSRVENLAIWAGPQTRGGVGLQAVSCWGEAAGNHVFRNLTINSAPGGGLWLYTVQMDGSNRPTGPAGLRNVLLDNVAAFNATWTLASFWNCHTCEWRGGGAWQGAGTARGISVGQSTNVRLDMVYERPLSYLDTAALR